MIASARSRTHRALASLLALLIAFGPLATPAYADLTKLADEPLNVKNSAKPNIVLTVDDSTSMLFDFLPDYIIGTLDPINNKPADTFCRDSTGKMAARCGQEGMLIDLSSYPGGTRGKYVSPGYIYEQFGYPYPAYATGFDTSGPGEGCDRAAPRCSGGVDPGPVPGLSNYPATSASAGTPYEYWLLWPAPVHNSALNHLYYNPRLTYEPASKADGKTRYPTMNAENTKGSAGPWTAVPADPFAANPVLVDLTRKVQIGQWCNSDWTQGVNPETGKPYATDPAFCRSNGTTGEGTSGAPLANGDYMYPWPWPGGSAAKDPKYFYARSQANVSGVNPSPNDNILWCDASSPYWPANGALTVPQTCNGYTSTAQTCQGATAQTCAGQPQTCGSFQSQTCSSFNQTCKNIVNTQTCNSSSTQTCQNVQSQTCVGSKTQTCANIATQTCTGAKPQTCDNITAQTCNNAYTQTCANITSTTVCTPPPPSSCTTTLGPPGCGGPEGPVCTPTTTCPPDTCVTTTAGKCSVTQATCTSSAQCPAQQGTCSVSAGKCSTAADCTPQGACTFSKAACTAANAATVCTTISGTCSKSGAACTANAQCPATGNCSVQTGTLCTSANAATVCPTINGTCSKTGATCTAANASTTCPATGNCSVKTGVFCTAANVATTCPTINGACSLTGAACTNANASATCPTQGRCDRTNALCTTANAATTCPPTAGTCSATGVSCTTTNAATNCPAQGKCSISNATCTSANAATTCPVLNPTCSATGAACTPDVNGKDAVKCPIQPGICNLDKASCTVSGDCKAVESFGTCSFTGLACGGSKGVCPNVASASSTATCSTVTNIKDANGVFVSQSLLQDAENRGVVCRRNNKGYTDVSAGRFNYPSGKYTTAVTGGLGATTVWVEDAVPTGATQTIDQDQWTWVTANPAPFSGTRAHQSVVRAGQHQHYFTNASVNIKVGVGDTLFTYVYLDPTNPPSEVMLQFYDSNADWNHRAYWGGNLITFGADGTSTRRYMGALPQKGTWVRLAVPASAVGLEGLTVTGMAYTLYDGKATWDYSGVAKAADGTSASTMDACAPTPAYTLVPRHYWKTEVEWCDGSVADGTKWAGYGESRNSKCQPFRDNDHRWPRFYKFGTPAGTDNDPTPAFQRVDLDIANRSNPNATYKHTWTEEVDDKGAAIQTTVERTFDEEMTNYANWFAYYRTRILAVKTVTSLVFKELDDTYRVGFHTLSNSEDRPFVTIADFNSDQKTAWFDRLFGLTIALNQETPNLEAIVRVGEYFRTAPEDKRDAALKGATDPIVLSCQKNWHMLFTDGLTNQPAPTAVIPIGDNVDKIVPKLPVAVPGLKDGDPWPPFYRENAAAAVDRSASDYVTYYWVTDFRAEGSVNGTTKAAVGENNVPSGEADPATWQHQNFAAMSLGTEGDLPAGNQSETEKSLAKGDLSWPKVWPSVNRPNQSGVDDLWHAAVNGRGQFVNAQSADELRLGMGKILQDITNLAGSRAGVGFQGLNLSAGNKYVYRVGFEPGWGGMLTKVLIDPLTGNEIEEVWRASKQLNDQVAVVPGVKDTPWFSERKIATMDPTGKAVPFLWGNLDTFQQESLSMRSSIEKPSDTRGKQVLEFLRGNQSREGVKLNQFRLRKTVLGDIANSQAVFVGPPRAPYLDANDPGYSDFKAGAAATRPGRVYVGANDGMLHAFDDASGAEAWAYVPFGVYRKGSTGLGALSLQDGALPAFQHHFFVDSTPRVIDANIGGTWRSVLVGGLGKGGKSYYAIDVTDPNSVTNETELTKKVLWEFSDPQDLGFTYGRPVIVKTHAFNGAWLAILPSGYNNESGVGKVFFVNLATGKLEKVMSTGVGDTGTPSGLGHISGFTQDYRNQVAEQIYGGDLLGNFWRFDISDSDPSHWKVEKLATLTDPHGAAQPVTTPPQIEVDLVNGIDRWVFVGTGRLYHNDDLLDEQIQTMYAIRDGTLTKPGPIEKAITRDLLVPVTDKEAVTGLATRPEFGWYDDLPKGQRIVVPPQATLSVVSYAAAEPQNDPCLTGQPSTVYARGYAHADALLEDETGATIESFSSPAGGVGVEIISMGSSVATDGSEFPNIVIGVTLAATGKLKTIKIKLPEFFTAHRMSWRLLNH